MAAPRSGGGTRSPADGAGLGSESASRGGGYVAGDMTTLEVTTERADGVAVVTLSGEVNADNAAQLDAAFGDLLAGAGTHNFVVDLSGVVVIDGAGLAELVNFFKRVRIGPGDVRLCRFPTWVKVMFAMTRLNKVFDSFETREAAVASFAPAESE